MKSALGDRPAIKRSGGHAIMRVMFGTVAVLVAALGFGFAAADAQTVSRAQMAPAQRDQQVCAECHSRIDASYNRALLHAEPGAVTCLSCHHLDLTNDPRKVEAKRVETCVGCHRQVAPTHAKLGKDTPACTSCHSIHGDASVARKPMPSARCQGCHEGPHALHRSQASLSAKGPKPECVTCHTLHGDKTVQAGFNSITPTCVSCHKRPHPSHPPAGNQDVTCTACHSMASDPVKAAVPKGAALTKICLSCHEELPGGHAVTHGAAKGKATQCEDCHSFATDVELPRAQAAISQRCSNCHATEMNEFTGGGHNKALAATGPNRDAPNCVTCHTTHRSDSLAVSVEVAANQRCIQCHSDEKLAKKYDLPRYAGDSYMKDFHGATLGFVAKNPTGEGQPDVMTCSDCHGAHAVAWNVSARVDEVCASCHGKASTKLAGAWLGHDKPSPTNQPLVWLIKLFYYVLIPFVLAGLTLHIAFQLIDQRRRGARMLDTLRKRFARRKEKVATVTRFSRLERSEHLGSMLTFILLVLTGLPQTRPDLEIAHRMIEMFGGITTLRWIHRATGLIFVALLIQHVARAVIRVFRTHRMPVMATSAQDFKDAFGTVKHFIWGTPRPKTGKFDFSEKFEYWGLFMGGTLMSVTGVALLFPELITQYVPGLFVAMFRVMHGLEATFAVLVVALWHSYGVILRPEVFPLDTSIFTGEIPVERLEEEHALEYERLFPEHLEEAEEEEHALVG